MSEILKTPDVTDWLIAICTLFIALFTYFMWQVNKRMAWLTGAMETHSNRMLQIEAFRGVNGTPIECIWWDPNVEEIATKMHNEHDELDKIYFYLPSKDRAPKPRQRVWQLWRKK